MDETTFGVEYLPKLTASVLDPLSSWIFRKQEEEKGRLALRADQGDGAEPQKTSGKADEGGVLVVTSDGEIEGTLRNLLSELMAYFHSEPSVAALKAALAKKPHLVVLHLSGQQHGKKAPDEIPRRHGASQCANTTAWHRHRQRGIIRIAQRMESRRFHRVGQR